MWKLDNFADIANTKPWSIDTSKFPGMDEVIGSTSSNQLQVKKAWAPQVIWDPDVGKYMLYWSVGAENNKKTQVYYTYTSDFKSDFTTVKRLMYPDFDGAGITNHIDADITYHNGLYYCYFKNEDSSGTGAKRIWYAVAPNANGPYTDFELVETGYGSEGPQVYEVSDGAYMLMVDGYGDGTYHMYSASTPYDFTNSNGTMVAESSTNVTALSPRHGSIVRISDAEYQKLKKLRIGEELRYDWQTEGSYPMNKDQTDSTGNVYHVTWNPSESSTTTTGGGVLSITDSGMYSELLTVQNFIASDVYSVTFNYKSNSSTTRDDTHSIFSISKSNAVENYVRLTSNGKFIVNNSQVEVSGNCSDGTTTRASKLSDAVNDTSNFHRFTVTSDGFSTSLIIDGEFICQTITKELDIPNTLWITFGWARIPNYENNRLTAQFGQVIFKNVATETDKQDELYDTLKPANVNVGTFSTKSYYQDDVATGGYSNVVYAVKGDSEMFKSNNDDFIDHYGVYFKLHIPKTTVLVYDGANEVSSPIVAETKRHNKTNVRRQAIYYIASKDGTFYFDDKWYGYHDSSGNGWKTWPTTTTSSFGYLTSNGSTYSISSTNDTSRMWKNKLVYHGTGDTTNYYETIGNITFSAGAYFDYTVGGEDSGAGDIPTTFSNYVINYKPIYDILNGTTKVPNTNNMTISQLFANDADNRWMYTKASYEQALYAMKLLADCNPNNYNYSSDAAGQVAQCGKDIAKAIEAFNDIKLVKNKFNITYRMANGTTKAEVVTAGDALASVPSNTATYHIADSNTHKKNCHWDSVTADSVPVGATGYTPLTTPVNGFEPQANTVYTETGTVEECTKTTVAASGDVNAYSYYNCSVCGYENDDYKIWDEPLTEDNWTAYDAKVDTIATKAADTQYTTSSRAAYETDARTIANGVVDGDPSKSEKYINDRIAEITTAEGKLNPVADFTALDADFTADGTNYANKWSSKNVDGSGNQVYTYNSWVNFASNYKGGKSYHDYNAATRADTPKYTTDASGYVKEKIAANYSTEQLEINTYAAELPSAYTALTPVDAPEAYTNYEAAKTLVNSTLDSRKYTQDGINYINGQMTTADGNVYEVLDATSAEAYNRYTDNENVYKAGDKLKKTTTGATDRQTESVLSASTTLNSAEKKDKYIKKYNVSLTVQDDESGDSIGTGKINNTTAANLDIPYGDTATLEVPESLLGSTYSGVAVWGTENRNDANTSTDSSQKVSGTASDNNLVYAKVVSGNIAVTAGLSKNQVSDKKYRYNVQNVYGEIVAVYYGSSALTPGTVASITLPGTSEALVAKEVPFYTFVDWTVTDNGNKVYTVKPNYDVAEATFKFSVTGGTISATKQDYDKRVTLDATAAGFVAWAVRTKSGTYQIASYNSNYMFFACADEDYVAIVSDGKGGYQTSDGTAITGANIDGAVATGTTLTDAQKTAIVNDKIANHKPFIAIEGVKMTNTQARAYARITQGATGSTGYGVYYKGGNNLTPSDDAGATMRTVTSALSTGQFTYTLNNKNGFKVNSVLFKCYVNYPAAYVVDGKSYTINATDFSATQVANKNA